MVQKHGKKSAKSVKNLRARRLTTSEAKAVRGGAHKHLAGVKYEDITINSGTGVSKPAS